MILLARSKDGIEIITGITKVEKDNSGRNSRRNTITISTSNQSVGDIDLNEVEVTLLPED
jgi:hypothetical protein